MRRSGLLAAGLLLAACGASNAGGAVASPSPSRDTVTGTVNVSAAASLTAAFKDEGRAFQARHPQARVLFNFAGSAALAASIANGAPADVFASADLPNLQKVVSTGNAIGQPATFATNQLQMVVAPGNPRAIRGLSDLANPGLLVVLCAPAVPCGSYAGQALAKAGVRVTARSQEQDVNAVLTKVATGEADAGIVYVTDVRAAGARVQSVDIPASQNVTASYPVVPVKGGSNPGGGQAFVEFLLSPAGQAILAQYGFGKP